MSLKQILKSETRLNAYYPDPEGGNVLVNSRLIKKMLIIKEGARVNVSGYDEFFIANPVKIISIKDKTTYLYNLYPAV